jgi:uncharacterized protein (DUF58 family)
MPRPSPEALQAAQGWRLALAETPPRGIAGQRLGKSTGASLEFQDRRTYAAGDDVRHLDWRAYARTDQLLVRQYREEVLPRVEILLDVSRSMAVEASKAQAAVDIVALIATAARNDSFQVQIALVGERPELVDATRFELAGAQFDGVAPWTECAPIALSLLRPGSMRVLVGDFLCPHSAADVIRPVAAHGGSLALVHLLGGLDIDPPAGSALRLTDSENETTRDLVLDRRTVERYRERLARLENDLESECRRSGALFASVDARSGISAACRDRLAPAGILAVA